MLVILVVLAVVIYLFTTVSLTVLSSFYGGEARNAVTLELLALAWSFAGIGLLLFSLADNGLPYSPRRVRMGFALAISGLVFITLLFLGGLIWWIRISV